MARLRGVPAAAVRPSRDGGARIDPDAFGPSADRCVLAEALAARVRAVAR
jgi:hypothetical protein